MRPLLDFARAIVPAEQQRSAVLLLRATAGMRLVSPPAAQRIYDSLYEAVRARRLLALWLGLRLGSGSGLGFS